jgi:hypothetical protein
MGVPTPKSGNYNYRKIGPNFSSGHHSEKRTRAKSHSIYKQWPLQLSNQFLSDKRRPSKPRRAKHLTKNSGLDWLMPMSMKMRSRAQASSRLRRFRTIFQFGIMKLRGMEDSDPIHHRHHNHKHLCMRLLEIPRLIRMLADTLLWNSLSTTTMAKMQTQRSQICFPRIKLGFWILLLILDLRFAEFS